jgi:hypothetical protein
MSDPSGEAPQMSEEEMRAAYEAELKRITIADLLIQTTVSLVNLAGRKLGISESTKDERDLDQARDGIDAVRALLPLIERRGDINAEPLREALSQLQIAYAREAGAGGGERGGEGGGRAPGGGAQPDAAGAGEQQGGGPPRSSGRLWIPGQ